jgi:Mg/Co/Ni transporter MgtE
MGTDLFTLTPDTVVSSALRLADAKRVRHFLVVENGGLTGIVCHDDLREARRNTLVGQCMKSPVLCIGPDTTIKDAAHIMKENEVGCLPVVTGRFLVGLITRDGLSDVVDAGRRAPGNASGDSDDEESAEGEGAPLVCDVCGGVRDVARDFRAGLSALCEECAASMPPNEALRGN